jgi:hypothetical protein
MRYTYHAVDGHNHAEKAGAEKERKEVKGVELYACSDRLCGMNNA